MNQWIDHFKQSSTGASIPEIDLAKPPLQAQQWQELRAAVKWQHTQFNLLVFTAAIVCLAFLLSAAVIAFSPEGLDRTRVGLLIACWMYLIVLTLFFERHAKKLPLKRFMGGAGEAGFSEIPAKDYPRVLVFIDGDHVAAQYVNSVLDQGRQGGSQLWGPLAVLVATMAWGTDNTLSRALAERDPGQVVLGKAVLGTSATALLAVLAGDPLPTLGAALGLMAVGATGYGLSLRFYLLAQRAFGAARTGSVR